MELLPKIRAVLLLKPCQNECHTPTSPGLHVEPLPTNVAINEIICLIFQVKDLWGVVWNRDRFQCNDFIQTNLGMKKCNRLLTAQAEAICFFSFYPPWHHWNTSSRKDGCKANQTAEGKAVVCTTPFNGMAM